MLFVIRYLLLVLCVSSVTELLVLPSRVSRNGEWWNGFVALCVIDTGGISFVSIVLKKRRDPRFICPNQANKNQLTTWTHARET